MKREKTRKYCIIKTKGDIETVLETFDNESDAIKGLIKLRDNRRITSGAYEAASIAVLPDGKLDKRDRETIEYYIPEIDEFLKSIGIYKKYEV